MPMTITPTTLCVCRHIRFSHDKGDDHCTTFGCHCLRFQVSARTSSSHYRSGQATTRKRVARLEEGDRILVVFTDDGQLQLADRKTGALVATVNAFPAYRLDGWRVSTGLGELPPLSGKRAVHVLTEEPPW